MRLAGLEFVAGLQGAGGVDDVVFVVAAVAANAVDDAADWSPFQVAHDGHVLDDAGVDGPDRLAQRHVDRADGVAGAQVEQRAAGFAHLAEVAAHEGGAQGDAQRGQAPVGAVAVLVFLAGAEQTQAHGRCCRK